MTRIAPIPRLKPFKHGLAGLVDEALTRHKNLRAGLALFINGKRVGQVDLPELEFHLGSLHIVTTDGDRHEFPIAQITSFATNVDFAFGGTFAGRRLIVELR